MLGGNLGSLLYGDVSVMRADGCQSCSVFPWHTCYFVCFVMSQPITVKVLILIENILLETDNFLIWNLPLNKESGNFFNRI